MSQAVLVVDDVSTVRTLVRRLLEMRGYRVSTAENGQQALEVLEREAGAIDLLLTDIVMPRMDGIALCERVAAQWPQLPVLVMSGDFSPAPPLPIQAQFLQKPFSPETLFLRVAQSLRPLVSAAGSPSTR
jgi:two-component system, cell cycle sensor histidine kinase and response regulator CckA